MYRNKQQPPFGRTVVEVGEPRHKLKYRLPLPKTLIISQREKKTKTGVSPLFEKIKALLNC